MPSAELHIVYQCQAFKNWVVVRDSVSSFLKCSPVKVIWEYFADCWTGVADENLTMTLKDFILGWDVILGWECTFYFYLFFFWCRIKVKKETERYIAVKNGTLNDSNRRWGLFLH